MTRAALLALVLAVAAAAPAAAQLSLQPLGTYQKPVHVASPPKDSRVFVVEKRGVVRIAGGGTFLDVTRRTSSTDERGLLSIAFPPNYARSGRFYVFLTGHGMPYMLEVVEYRRSSTDPDRADPDSARTILSIPHPGPRQNHNGGQLQFGPDGKLYVGTGDGGGTGDPLNNSQNLESELGKLLRVNARSGMPPRGNPFGTRVWAYGLRNPWRFSFDRGTGELWIGDVGQSRWEEIDGAPPSRGRGANFGWPCMEGTQPYRPACTAPGALAPKLVQPHPGFCAITGGYVVRDPGLPTLNGRYLYGDFCHATMRSVALDGTGDRAETAAPLGGIVSFGEDACGRMHVASYDGGVYRVQDGAATPCPDTDYAPPLLRMHIERPVGRRVGVAVRCSEACRATVAVRGGGRRRLRLKAGERVVTTLRMAPLPARRIVASVLAVDAVGNANQLTVRRKLAPR